jgi:hypothetical protein
VAKCPKDSPTVVFLPFSEDLLNAAKPHIPCWGRSKQSTENALISANYPSLGDPVNSGEGAFGAEPASSYSDMALVPYSPAINDRTCPAWRTLGSPVAIDCLLAQI